VIAISTQNYYYEQRAKELISM